MGHNLGMEHDFIDQNNPELYVPRFDSKGRPCSKIGGIMDYEEPFFKWSTCSVEDFNKYFNKIKKWCLKLNE
jgi:hypothetical protein